jgi:hypothetical protein
MEALWRKVKPKLKMLLKLEVEARGGERNDLY